MRTVWIGGLIGLSLAGTTVLAQKMKPATGLKAGLTGEYFNGPNFERKVLTRTDPQVDFDWNWQSPGPGVQREYFSVRWTGKLYAPTSGQYRFSATVDDGVRVWVGGKKVIDEWRKQDDSRFVGEIALNGKRFYDLRIEYYNDWKGSVISVFWESPEDRPPFSLTAPPRQLIPAKYLFSAPVKAAPASRPLPAETAPAIRSNPPPAGARLELMIRRSLVRPTETSRPVAKPAPPPSTVPVALPAAAKPKAAPAGVAFTTPLPAPKPVGAAVVPVPVGSVPVAPVGEPFGRLKSGEAVVLRQVVFAQSDYRLLPESYPELNKLVRVLQTNAALRVEIAGHTDNIGDKRLNQTLSEYRAKVVANYLIRRGIAATRLTAKGYGGSRPVVDNASEEGRAQNRRVEFIVD